MRCNICNHSSTDPNPMDFPVRCPECHHVCDLYDCEVVGAPDGVVYCPVCWEHIQPNQDSLHTQRKPPARTPDSPGQLKLF